MFKNIKILSSKVLVLSVIFILVIGLTKIVLADTATTNVIIGNAAPTISGNVAENPASYATTPTNVGANVTFQGTFNDSNSDNYYLAICKTAAISGNANAAPTCTGGNWCISGSTATGVQASCAYTALIGDAESNAWHAYACDHNSSSQCSSVNQGTGDSGSPFKVNHRPTFSAYLDTSPKNPGQTVMWYSTSTDPDSDTSADTVSLFVCKAADFTGTACGGTGTWCSSTGSSSDPACGYEIPNPEQDETVSAYGYIIDNHNFASTGASQGTDSSLVISNVAPTISAAGVSLLDTDSAGNLTLTVESGTTTDFLVTFTVADANGCQNAAAGNEISSVLTHVRRSGIAQGSCDADAEDNYNNCYANAQTGTGGQCTVTSACSGATDSDVVYTCELPLGYHTDSTVASTQYPTEHWLAAVQATDDDSASTSLTDGTNTNEMDTFLAYNLSTASIDYGTLAPSADSAEQTATVQATGNVGLDENLSGLQMESGVNTIAVGQQHYNLTASQGWPAGTALTGTPAEAELNCAKTTTFASPASANTYWMLRVPAGQASGTYTGTSTFTGITGESANW